MGFRVSAFFFCGLWGFEGSAGFGGASVAGASWAREEEGLFLVFVCVGVVFFVFVCLFVEAFVQGVRSLREASRGGARG